MASPQPADSRRQSAIPNNSSRVASPAMRTPGGGTVPPSMNVSRAVTPHPSKEFNQDGVSPLVDTPDVDEEMEEVPPPFPPPQLFDIVPPLHDLLARLITPAGTSQTPNPNVGLGGEPLLPISGAPGAGTLGGATSTVGSVAGGLSIDPKALQIESAAVRRRLQKAQAALEVLPDMHRSVEEQELEIQAVERQIARLKEVLADFGSRSSAVLQEMTQ